MKILAAAFAAAGIYTALFQAGSKPYVVVLSGDSLGYLAPCGCSEPMTGGVLREATAIRRLSVPGRTILLENDGLVQDRTRQDQIKAETLAEVFGALGVTALNLGPSDARLGVGAARSLARLSGDRLVSGSMEPSATNPVPPFRSEGPFLIGGITDNPAALAGRLGERPVSSDDAVRKLVDEASADGLVPILMLQGPVEEARRLARAFPDLGLIQYSFRGSAPSAPEQLGKTVLASPGERGKAIVKLTFSGHKFSGYQPIVLTPDYPDDPSAKRLYKRYLGRIADERLLEKMPRSQSTGYAGSQSCAPCHAGAYHIWKRSGHSHALKTLEIKGHDRDPDCVGCHVVGLNSTHGFRSRLATPLLASVGCESCHGPALAHVLNPKAVRLPRATERNCLSCHSPDNSPKFNFPSYWAKVKH